MIEAEGAASTPSSTEGGNVLGQLSERDKTRSALMISLAPYLKEKLDDTFESMRNEMEQDNLRNRSQPSGTGLSWEQRI